jgi:hypothetical protein
LPVFDDKPLTAMIVGLWRFIKRQFLIQQYVRRPMNEQSVSVLFHFV